MSGHMPVTGAHHRRQLRWTFGPTDHTGPARSTLRGPGAWALLLSWPPRDA
jgi:hypothetical protein